MEKIYLVALLDVKTDSVIESTLQAFSTRTKQIIRINELRDVPDYKSGLCCIFATALVIH